jgi:hypothetical protein
VCLDANKISWVHTHCVGVEMPGLSPHVNDGVSFVHICAAAHAKQPVNWPVNRMYMIKQCVFMQVLQTLSILIQNIRSTNAIFYLFSNNHINAIVAMSFDFKDDEVLGYYINLLKTISLKLDSKTVQFFFHDGEQSSFPLYSEAIKFVNHRDGMVRAAVRTLTLNVYGIKDRAVQGFVAASPASNYFYELAILIKEQCEVRESLVFPLLNCLLILMFCPASFTAELRG